MLCAVLWRKVFEAARDLLGDVSRLTIVKVKAHLSLSACDGDPELIYRRGGNCIADRGAKLGAAMHPKCEETLQKVTAATSLVREVSVFIGRAAEWRWQQYGKEALWGDSAVREVVEKDDWVRPPPASSHRAVLDKALRWRCTVCLTTAKDLASLRSVQYVDGSDVAESHKLRVAGQICVLRPMRAFFCCSLPRAEGSMSTVQVAITAQTFR